ISFHRALLSSVAGSPFKKPITITEQEGGSIAGEDEPRLPCLLTKPDPKRLIVSGAEPPRLSMGYDFVGFKTGEDVKKGIKGMQGFVLDGYALHFKFAGRGTGDEPKDKVDANLKSTSTKECTVRSCEEGYQSESCLAPTVISSPSSLVTHEAENAYAALRHKHLLGRYLVPEWAEEVEQDIEVLWKKAGVEYGDAHPSQWCLFSNTQSGLSISPLPTRRAPGAFYPCSQGRGSGNRKFVVIQWTLDAIMYVYRWMRCPKAAKAHTQATVEIMEK
ncbi:hypothetical protein AZE42_12292, partial [Rhizopogon vesiculosus]